MKRFLIAVTILAMVTTSLVYGTAKGATPGSSGKITTEGTNSVKKGSIEAVNQFSYDTASRLLKSDGKNYCYSPLSLYYALALATTGAGGGTRDELLSVLGMPNTEELSKQSNLLYHSLYTNGDVSKLKISNSLWLDDEVGGNKVTYKDSFIHNAVQNFDASLFSVDFANADTGKKMSKWISEHTNNTLSPTINVDPAQVMSILNTVYYFDQWMINFDKARTTENTFQLHDGNRVKCNFMNDRRQSGFVKGSNFTRAELPLKNKCRMVFVLPDKACSVSKLMETPEKLRAVFTQGVESRGEVTWSVPKFSCDSKYDLVGMMQKLGVKKAFTDAADFTGISDYGTRISGIIQQTHIAVNESGVEASAFTQIGFATVSIPTESAEMILNRPFLYGIVTNDNIPLFVGVCNDPS
jgi:serine protease inhibitor